MKLLRYGPAGREKPGLLDANGKIRDLSGQIADVDGQALTSETLGRLAKLDPATLPIVDGSPRLGCPVGSVSKFVAVGLNYADHAAEANMALPSEPILGAGRGEERDEVTRLGAALLHLGNSVVGGFGASMRGPGHVHHNGLEMIRFGALKALPTQRLQASAKIWESSGFKVTLFEDVQRMVWEKLIMNVTFSGTTCATGLTIGEVMADPNAWGVALSCAKEAIAVADAIGVKMEVGNPIEHIKKLGSKIPNARPSMLLDYNAGRRGEVDAINSSIPRLGKGVPTPANETVVGIIKAREAGFPA